MSKNERKKVKTLLDYLK